MSGTDNLAVSQGSVTGTEKEEKEEEEDSLTEHLTESMIQIPQIEMPPPKPPAPVWYFCRNEFMYL